MMTKELSGSDALRYLDADHVKHPSGTFADLTIFSPDDHKLGAISGVLVEPASRHPLLRRRTPTALCGSVHSRRTIPAVLEAYDGKLASSRRGRPRTLDARTIERYSEEDAITAMFSRPAA